MDASKLRPGEHLCPVCGKTVFSGKRSYDICEECGWEDDTTQEDGMTANEMVLKEYREAYLSGWRPDWLVGHLASTGE